MLDSREKNIMGGAMSLNSLRNISLMSSAAEKKGANSENPEARPKKMARNVRE